MILNDNNISCLQATVKNLYENENNISYNVRYLHNTSCLKVSIPKKTLAVTEFYNFESLSKVYILSIEDVTMNC